MQYSRKPGKIPVQFQDLLYTKIQADFQIIQDFL